MDPYSFLNTAHTAYFAELYDQYLQNPDAVEPTWRAFFQGFDFGLEHGEWPAQVVDVQVPESVKKEFQVVKLIEGYRSRGHLFTKTNPVRNRRTYSPDLSVENFGLTKDDLPTIFNRKELEVTQWGTIKINYKSMMTNIDGVFAAGDIVRGASLVVWGIKDGRDVAEHIDKFVKEKEISKNAYNKLSKKESINA